MAGMFALRNQLEQEFKKESDRGCAVLTVCLLEESLAALFSRVLPGGENDAKHFVPRGRLSVAVGNALALGLIDEPLARNFKLILEIRNTFAHKLLDGISFDSEEIRLKVNQLKLPNIDPAQRGTAQLPEGSRERYMMAVDMLFFTLEWMTEKSTRLHRRAVPNWTVREIPAEPRED